MNLQYEINENLVLGENPKSRPFLHLLQKLLDKASSEIQDASIVKGFRAD